MDMKTLQKNVKKRHGHEKNYVPKNSDVWTWAPIGSFVRRWFGSSGFQTLSPWPWFSRNLDWFICLKPPTVLTFKPFCSFAVKLVDRWAEIFREQVTYSFLKEDLFSQTICLSCVKETVAFIHKSSDVLLVLPLSDLKNGKNFWKRLSHQSSYLFFL